MQQLQQDSTNSRVEVIERSDGKLDKWAPKYLAVAKPLKEYVLPEAEQVVKIIDMGGGMYKATPESLAYY